MRGSQAALAKQWVGLKQQRPLFYVRDDGVRGHLIISRDMVFDIQQILS